MRSHVYSTYPVGKISTKFKANRFFIFKLRNSFANYFCNRYEIITADLLVPALCPHTGVDVPDVDVPCFRMLSGMSLLFCTPGGVGKEKSSHKWLFVYLEDFEVEGLGVSNPKLLSLWYSRSDSSDNVDGDRERSRFKDGVTIRSGEKD